MSVVNQVPVVSDNGGIVMGRNVAKVLADGEGILIGVTAEVLPHLRETVRQQLLGDRELLVDLEHGRELVDEGPETIAARLAYLNYLDGLMNVSSYHQS